MSPIFRWSVFLFEQFILYLIYSLTSYMELSIFYQCLIVLNIFIIILFLEIKGINHKFFDLLIKNLKFIKINKKFISLKEAINFFGEETKCYFYNGHDKVFEQEKITQEQCYKSILLDEIKNERLILYGYKKISTTKKLEQIPINCISDKTIRNPEYDNIYSVLDEILYTNLLIRIDNLNQIIKHFKS